MRPKGKLFALVVLFAAVGLITATGAFTTVEAERTATIDVAGDADALLALEPADGDQNNGAVQQTNNELTVDLTSPGSQGAEGINPNANTTFNPAINVTNQGTNQIDLSVGISINSGDLTSNNIKLNATGGDTAVSGDITQTTVTLNSGETVELALILDLTSDSGNQINTLGNTDVTITFTANDSSP
jgi:hypothetical protein